MSNNRTTKWIAGLSIHEKACVAKVSGVETDKQFLLDKKQDDENGEWLLRYRKRIPKVKNPLSDTRDEAVQRACVKMLQEMKLLDAEKLQLDQTYWAMKALLGTA